MQKYDNASFSNFNQAILTKRALRTLVGSPETTWPSYSAVEEHPKHQSCEVFLIL